MTIRPPLSDRAPWRLAAAVCMALLAAGCGGWFGDSEDPPLPGARVAVLLHDREIAPDPSTKGLQILLPAPVINTSWPMAGGFANHAMHHLQVSSDLRNRWRADIGRAAGPEELYISTPIVGGGVIFTMDANTQVRAFNIETGEKLWSAELTPGDEDDGHIGGGIAFELGRLYVTTGFGQVVALDSRTGAVLWRVPLGAPLRTPPTVRGGRVFVLTVDNKLYALSAHDGSTFWKYSSISEVASLLGGGSPAVKQGVVVAAFSSGELVALKAETGRILWSDSLGSVRRTAEISSLAHIRGRPIIDRGLVIAISHGGLVTAIDLRTGQRVWDREIGGKESPWVAGDFIFLISNDSALICLSRKDGRIVWVSQLPRWTDEKDKYGAINWTGPILVSDRLIVAGSHGQALAVSPYSGRFMGEIEMPDKISVPPIAAQGSVFFLTDDADLVAYR